MHASPVDDDRIDIAVLDHPRPVSELVLADTHARSSGIHGALFGALAGAAGPLGLWAAGMLASFNLAPFVLFAMGSGALFGALGGSLLGLSFPSDRAFQLRRKLRGDHAMVEVRAQAGLLADDVARLTRLFRRAGAERVLLPGGAAT